MHDGFIGNKLSYAVEMKWEFVPFIFYVEKEEKKLQTGFLTSLRGVTVRQRTGNERCIEVNCELRSL